eukprot:268611-Pleurochrysis_carterae.AAC.1
MALAEARVEAAGGAVLRWGVWGHSAGAGTATTLPGKFELGRAALCGYRGARSPTYSHLLLHAAEDTVGAPLLLVGES